MRLGFRRDYGHKVPLSEWNRLRSGNQGLREGGRGRLQQERAILQLELGALWQQRGDTQVINYGRIVIIRDSIILIFCYPNALLFE